MKVFLNSIFFPENHHPTRYIKYKVIDFAPSNNSITANKLPSTNLECFLRQIESPVTCRYYIAHCPKLTKMAIFTPP